MNSLIKSAALSGLLFGTLPLANAAPFAALGEDVSIFVDASAGLEHQSNIGRSSNNEESETIFVVSPGLEFRLGGEGSSVAQLKVGYEFRRHFNQDQLNGEYARVNFASLYDTDVLLLKTYFGYNEFGTNSQVIDGSNLDIIGVADRSDLTAGASFKYRFTEQMSFGAGADFAKRDWDNGYALYGYDSIALPVKLYFAIAPELDAFVGYRHREVDTSSNRNSESYTAPNYSDDYFFVGVEGELFSPLITANIDLGFQTRSYEDIQVGDDSNDALTFSARVNYAADVNRSYYAVLARDFGQSANGAVAFERTRYTIGGTYQITEMWSALASVTFASTDYDRDPQSPHAKKRSDDILSGKIGVTWAPNDYLSINGSFNLIDLDSDNSRVPGYDGYKNEVVSVTASVRY